MIGRNFDILAVLALALVLAGADEFRDRVQRVRLSEPGVNLVVEQDLDAFSRIERRFNQRLELFDRRINERAARLHDRLERLPLCPLDR
jgi:hypothetical protein